MNLQVALHWVGLLPENARNWDQEEQELHGICGQNIGAVTSFVGALDKLIVVQKRLRRK